MASTRKTTEYKSLKHITQQRVLRLDDKVFVHLDSFNINPTYNTDGIIKCLLQPGHIRNLLFTSMLSTSIRLLNSVYPDSSCCRDKVSRAAGRRAVGSVFCSPFRKCTVTSKLRFHYRDSYVREFYRDGTPCVRLPGLAKNSPTLTETAPNYTTEPLAFRPKYATVTIYT
jgi:hypothetical protein